MVNSDGRLVAYSVGLLLESDRLSSTKFLKSLID